MNAARLTIPMSVSEPKEKDTREDAAKENAVVDASQKQSFVEASPHTVRLHFSDPGPTKTAERIFSVSLQGQTVIEGLDIATAAGRSQKTIVHEFRHISIGNELTIDLSAQHGQTVLCGVEIVSEQE